MLIDSGSMEKLVSKEVVNKLKLRRVPHKNPYKVSCLKNKQQNFIEEQAFWNSNLENKKAESSVIVFQWIPIIYY